ncbi:MAG: hypothetical protein M1818_006822 [Claussenomyces sp. TS43310]|nr:MAG: hypothetical protein M1818_006822 [Claussenomyces sp. TS43310]
MLLSMNAVNSIPSQCAPVTDTMDRHDYGVRKSRKPVSTGGGRAWSEDEEVYLLQTRLQKMPYKYIAAHLRKTELACRLHYHQISRGSHRRKRSTSTSSLGFEVNRSAMDKASASNMPSTVQEYSNLTPPSSCTISPVTSYTALSAASSLLPHTDSRAPTLNPTTSQPMAPVPKPVHPFCTFSDPSLKLECAVPPATPQIDNDIDIERLSRIYGMHRVAFWAFLATEYGGGVSAIVLEQAFKNSFVLTPPTPCASPDLGCHSSAHILSGVKETRTISISALLGIDAHPTSRKEREIIRLMEAQVERL